MLPAIIHGFFLALGLILPLGAQNIFIFNQGARSKRFTEALPSILAASLSDTLLIFLAVAGVSLLIRSFPLLQNIFLVIGLIFLILIGWTIWKNPSADKKNQSQRLSIKKQILFTLSVSLLNPHAVMDTIGIIGTNALHYSGSTKWAFAASCATVSWIWFSGLSLAGHFLTERLASRSRSLVLINKVSALIIWGIALYLGFVLLRT
ncbi:amino acid transporter [Sporolactobacillus shoreae]|uniref:Amino acid transporter n=1 Tax=Sporolactobacillus shoreae TaxID=1465501 RepID=A0A4Z0GL18_9BACL|nr:LysE/ArgO family amino acid transporter [Sporolactobacillus shoreae]TGA97625.1 amino acid transporter [Sporolactobacillus shoreae]